MDFTELWMETAVENLNKHIVFIIAVTFFNNTSMDTVY